MKRHQNHGVRKTCRCGRRRWATCRHAWSLNFKWGATHYRLALDKEVGRKLKDRDEAQAEADTIRGHIRAGTFRQPAPPVVQPADLTFKALAALWVKRELAGRGVREVNDRACLAVLAAVEVAPGEALGARPIGRITEDDLEAVFDTFRTTKAASTRNHYLQALKSLERWGRRKGYLDRPWLGEFTTIKREKHARRDRRLVPDVLTKDGKVKTPGEERRLLAVASPWMQRLILAALETCCRRGELLSLQWLDVDMTRGTLTIRAEKAKTNERRILPISTRLRAVLEMIRQAPDGTEHEHAAYVFGNAAGEHVASPKKAWGTVCRKAGITDLHFHDLRHEGASRLVEAGWPLHHVQVMLGHSDLKQTSTYTNATLSGLLDSMRRLGTARNARATAPLPTVSDRDQSSTRRTM